MSSWLLNAPLMCNEQVPWFFHNRDGKLIEDNWVNIRQMEYTGSDFGTYSNLDGKGQSKRNVNIVSTY